MMDAPTVKSDVLFAVLKPEKVKLCQNAPQFGELILKVNIHDGNVSRVTLGIETARRIATCTISEGR
jgi:hypothetical protein